MSSGKVIYWVPPFNDSSRSVGCYSDSQLAPDPCTGFSGNTSVTTTTAVGGSGDSDG